MIESIHIENFRCFRHTEADDLGRINVIVGDNGAGKTALLEAIYLVTGNTPENHLKLRSWRTGEASTYVTSNEVQSGSLWDDMFHSSDTSLEVNIQVRGTQTRQLQVLRQESTTVPLGSGTTPAPVTFTWSYGNGDETECIPRLHPERGIEYPTAIAGPGVAFLSARVPGAELAQRYSELDRKNLVEPAVRAVQEQWPEIKELKPLSFGEHKTEIYAVEEGIENKIPLSFVSSGINRLFYILVTIASFPGGTVCIDEFDYGLYHKRLTDIWKAVHQTATDTNTQVFVTTHSGEAIAALDPLIKGNEEDFRLIRVKRDKKNGESSVHVSSARNLAAAIEGHIDIR